jgi:HD-like signal output (HDOD) protein
MPTVHAPLRLPLQPLTAVAVLRTADSPDLSADTLARLVEIDPALTAMVLRLANAPLFGFLGRVTSARQATLLLGTRTVGALAVGGTAALVFRRDDAGAPTTPEPDGRVDETATPDGCVDETATPDARKAPDAPGAGGAWAHAVATACASSVVAQVLGVHPDEAFTAGMLHNAAWLLPAGGDDVVGCAPEASAELLRAWALPKGLVNAVRAHAARPDAAAGQLARALAVAHAIVPAVTDGSAGALAAAQEAVVEAGIGAARLDELLAAVRREIEAVAGFIEEQSR